MTNEDRMFIITMSKPERDYTLCNDKFTYSMKSFKKVMTPIFKSLDMYGQIWTIPDDLIIHPKKFVIGRVLSVDLDKFEAKVILNEDIAMLDYLLDFEGGNWFIGYTTNANMDNHTHLCDIEKFNSFALCSGRLTRSGFNKLHDENINLVEDNDSASSHEVSIDVKPRKLKSIHKDNNSILVLDTNK